LTDKIAIFIYIKEKIQDGYWITNQKI
jgi:transcriptional regulator with XRE-family HTH domain